MATNNTHVIDELATSGAPTITDADGIDWLVYSSAFTGMGEIYLGGRVTTVEPFTPNTTFAYTQHMSGLTGMALNVLGIIENAKGGAGSDKIVGNEHANTLYGDLASTGVGGNDTVFGFSGNDTIYGGNGHDLIDGGSGLNTAYGGAGNDSISGAKVAEGGAGADDLSGRFLGDTVSYAGSSAGVRVTLSANLALLGQGGDAEGDKISGFTNLQGSEHADVLVSLFGPPAPSFMDMSVNVLTGRGGNDSLDGGKGTDTIYGGTGNDTVIGGAGEDRLSGGAGADRFVFAARTHSSASASLRDAISDFKHAEGDRIDLRDIDAKSGTAGTNDAFKFIGEAAFHRKAGELQVVDAGANLVLRGDTNGDGKADFSVMLSNVAKLVAGDFIL